MNNPLEKDIYYYGSMKDYKHRNTLKDVDWGNPIKTKFWDVLGGIGFILTLLLIIIW